MARVRRFFVSWNQRQSEKERHEQVGGPDFHMVQRPPAQSGSRAGQEFGQLTAAATGAILMRPASSGSGVHSGVNGNSSTQVATAGNAASGGSGLNLFGDPNAVFSSFRPILLAQDTTSGGGGQLRGLARWNLDLSVTRKFQVRERASVSFNVQAFNFLNHVHFNGPSVSLDASCYLESASALRGPRRGL
jgi:hypothetical protein